MEMSVNSVLGIAMLIICGSGAYLTYNAIQDKAEHMAFRFSKLIFALFFFLFSLVIASFLR
jgi:glycerol uptake facilitator-like aquaporin